MIPHIRAYTIHIAQLARIVATEQGEPSPDARGVTFGHNSAKDNSVVSCGCGHEWAWGDHQWHAHIDGEDFFCMDCLPRQIECGELIRDDWSALETLAFMLAGADGKKEFNRYFTACYGESSRHLESVRA